MIKYFIICAILTFFILHSIQKKESEKKMQKKDEKLDEKEVQMKIKENDEIVKDSEPYEVFNEILKLKKKKYGSYRNYPNQNSLRKIVRSKPRYLNNPHYDFSEYNFEHEKIEVEKSKYDLILEREERFFNKKPLPDLYFVDEIVLMPKNTNTLFVYWEIRSETFERIINSNTLSDKYPKIILKDLNEKEIYTITAYNNIGSMYINNVECDKDYVAHLGFIDDFGHFIEVAHSTEVNVPLDRQSDNLEVTWGYADKKYFDNRCVIDFRKLTEKDAILFPGYAQEITDNELIWDDKNTHLNPESINYSGSSNLGGASDKVYNK